ncbi:MAG: ABC transporter permease [Candidatus Diapherotrites archaeon]|nr:ABC transporter permease [Candidatus Diapherotrites archaeon]
MAIYTIWLREMLHFIRDKSRIIGSMGMPLFFLLFIGTGLNSAFSVPGGVGYMEFMAPGIVGMILLFGSIFSGLNVVADKQFGFMKEMLVAPVPRSSLVLGKTLGGASTALLQALLLLSLVFLLGAVKFSLIALLLVIPIMFFISASFVNIGIIFATRISDPHGFQVIMNFFIMPLFFLSGALFPVDNLPGWLKILVLANPLTYGIDGLRGILIGHPTFPLWIDFTILVVFSAITVLIGAYAFEKMQ